MRKPPIITKEEYDTLNIEISLEEFNEIQGIKKIEMKCIKCCQPFTRKKSLVVRSFRKHGKSGFCSTKCHNQAKINKLKVNCQECNKEIEVRFQSWSKNKNHYCFCSYSCATKHRNKNKTIGYKRSKMEEYLENKIKQHYPLLEFACNNQKILQGLELDFYFPNFKLAIELNGITHYEPIYGLDRLTRSQDSDKRKMAACLNLGIELAIIDISMYKYFSEKSGDKIWIEIDKILSPLYQYAINNLTHQRKEH